MAILSDSVLVESKSARSEQLASLSHERAQEILGKVKSLYFALWRGMGIATNEQIAEFYEVSTDVLKDNVRRHRDEFESDGLKALRGKALKDAGEIISLPSRTSQATAWTPRAALRLGMLLRDSAVAKEVRTSLLDAVEKVIPAQQETIEELRLKLKLANAQNQLISGVAFLEGMAPGLGQLALGNKDASVERVVEVEKHVVVNERGHVVHEHAGQSPTSVAKSLGMTSAKELKRWLKSVGKLDLLESAQTIINCEHIRTERINEIRTLWAAKSGDRQKLIGE